MESVLHLWFIKVKFRRLILQDKHDIYLTKNMVENIEKRGFFNDR